MSEGLETKQVADWPTTLRVVVTDVEVGNPRVCMVVSTSEPRPFAVAMPLETMALGREYEVEMTVMMEWASGGIAVARADVIHEIRDMPDEEMKQTLRDMIDPDAVAAFVAQEKTP